MEGLTRRKRTSEGEAARTEHNQVSHHHHTPQKGDEDAPFGRSVPEHLRTSKSSSDLQKILAVSPDHGVVLRQTGSAENSRCGVLLQYRFCPWDGNEFRPLEAYCSECGASRGSSRYTGFNQQTLAKLLLPAWERILWKKQPYHDNYVDKTFLESLVKNANFHEYDIFQIVKDSVVVSQHLAGTVLFLGIGYLTIYDALSLHYMLIMDVLMGFAGVTAILLSWLHNTWKASGEVSQRDFFAKALHSLSFDHVLDFVAKYIRQLFLFLVALYTLSPILRTLTEPLSDDTVAAMTISFLSAHLLAHDYRWVNGREKPFGGSVALNAAMFVSVLIASRSSSNLHVSLLMCAAVEIFALAPRVYRQVKLTSEQAHCVMTASLVLCALVVLYHINQLLGFVFGFSIFFITWIAPLTFMYIQRYKNKLNGPWDEAVPIRRHDKLGGEAGTGRI